jgi:hypothetical protein
MNFILSNPKGIYEAGKSLKNVVYLILFNILCLIIGILIIKETHKIKTIQNTYYIIGTASLILNILVISFLYKAGDNLEKSVKINLNEDNLIDSEPKTPSF